MGVPVLNVVINARRLFMEFVSVGGFNRSSLLIGNMSTLVYGLSGKDIVFS